MHQSNTADEAIFNLVNREKDQLCVHLKYKGYSKNQYTVKIIICLNVFQSRHNLLFFCRGKFKKINMRILQKRI